MLDSYTPLLLDLPSGSLDGLTNEEIEEVQTLAAAAALYAARDIRRARVVAADPSHGAWGRILPR